MATRRGLSGSGSSRSVLGSVRAMVSPVFQVRLSSTNELAGGVGAATLRDEPRGLRTRGARALHGQRPRR